MKAGLIFVLAIDAFGTIAVFLAGWSSNNKYAMMEAVGSSPAAPMESRSCWWPWPWA